MESKIGGMMKKMQKTLSLWLAGLIALGAFAGCDLIKNSSNETVIKP